VVGVEDETGAAIGSATPLDAAANLQRRRRKPDPAAQPDVLHASVGAGPNLVELAYTQYHDKKGA
jgi:hypothetical protein